MEAAQRSLQRLIRCFNDSPAAPFAHSTLPLFDAVLCNPPYIAHADEPSLAASVAQYEPRTALFDPTGSSTGTGLYPSLLRSSFQAVKPSGAAFFEVGIGQHRAVAQAARAAGWHVADVRQDIQGTPRCIVLRKPASVHPDAPLPESHLHRE